MDAFVNAQRETSGGVFYLQTEHVARKLSPSVDVRGQDANVAYRLNLHGCCSSVKLCAIVYSYLAKSPSPQPLSPTERGSTSGARGPPGCEGRDALVTLSLRER